MTRLFFSLTLFLSLQSFAVTAGAATSADCRAGLLAKLGVQSDDNYGIASLPTPTGATFRVNWLSRVTRGPRALCVFTDSACTILQTTSAPEGRECWE